MRDHWAHTSSLMALIANVNRTSKTKPARPSDFNPMPTEPRAKATAIPAPITVLRDVFCDGSWTN